MRGSADFACNVYSITGFCSAAQNGFSTRNTAAAGDIGKDVIGPREIAARKRDFEPVGKRKKSFIEMTNPSAAGAGRNSERNEAKNGLAPHSGKI